MCTQCWRLVPKEYQQRVYATYKAGQESGECSPSPEWHAAANAAISFVQWKLRIDEMSEDGIWDLIPEDVRKQLPGDPSAIAHLQANLFYVVSMHLHKMRKAPIVARTAGDAAERR